MGQNHKVVLVITYLIILAGSGIAGAFEMYPVVAMGAIAFTMTYFYQGSLNDISACRLHVEEAERDEQFADDLMHQMWEEEDLEDKYMNKLIDYFTKESLFNFTVYFRKFTCSEVIDVEKSEWTYVKYCPFNHPFLFIPAFVKNNTIIITVSDNVDAIAKHFTEFATQEEIALDGTEGEDDFEDPGDDVDELDGISHLLLKIHKKT